MLIPVAETTDLSRTLVLCNLRRIPFIHCIFLHSMCGGGFVSLYAILNGLCGSV